MREGIPEYLVPTLGDKPVSSVRHYRTATVTRVFPAVEGTARLDGPVRVPRPVEVHGGMPAEGVLLTHEQSWVIEGTALGPLTRSVCLAPGEITQIAVRNQSRRVLENSVDRGLSSESLTRRGVSDSSLGESRDSSAIGLEAGSSTQRASSSSAEGGASFPLWSASGGSNSAEASQASTSTGFRSVSETANQNLHQAARDQASLARAESSTAVREVAESDSLELKTRVLANYNHMHALTMQYFDVEQVYQLRTRVTTAERLLFVPIKVVDFTDPVETRRLIGRYRTHIIDTARDLGLDAVAAKLAFGRLDADDPATLVTTTSEDGTEREGTIDRELDSLVDERTDARKALTDLIDEEHAAEDSANRARDELRAAGDEGLEKRASLQRELKAASAVLSATRETRERTERELRGLDARERELRERHDLATLALGLGAEREREESGPREAALHAELAERALAFNHGIWLRLDPSETAAMLRTLAWSGERLGESVDPTPIAVAGSRLGFRWRFTDADEAARFEARHVGASELHQSVSVPTGGVFGEAVLGESNAAEKIDLTRFWNWKDSLPPIRPAEIEALGVRDAEALGAATPAGVQPARLPSAAVAFQSVGGGIDAITKTLSDPELFRDLSGQEATAALAKSALELSAEGASHAAELAGENYRRFLSFTQSLATSVLGGQGRAGSVDPTLAGGALNAHRAAAPPDDPLALDTSGGGLPPAADAPPRTPPRVSFERDSP